MAMSLEARRACREAALRRHAKTRRPPVIIDADTVAVPLTRNATAYVDRADLERVAPIRWLLVTPEPNRAYAAAWLVDPETLERSFVYMHRFLTNAPDDMEVDHEDGDGLNNRRSNLRICTRSENARNQKPRSGRSYKGAYYDRRKKKWVARIKTMYRTIPLGEYATRTEALSAYDEGARRYHGEFARTNADIRN